MDLEPIKRTGIRAAYRAGRILRDHFGNIRRLAKKGVIDLVTEADVASEQCIVATIREVYPNHSILAEESGLSGADPTDRWIIDPLDGTTNYAHNLPIFAVSIAYAHQETVMVGIVFNPLNGELFTAVSDQGAFLNDTPIRVSTTPGVGDSLLVTGFPYTVASGDTDRTLLRFKRCLTAAQGVRRLGSAALDLCYVACGRFDGFWEENLKPWDTAAGMLVAREAGDRVTDYQDRAYQMEDKQILATNTIIHQEMTHLLTIGDA